MSNLLPVPGAGAHAGPSTSQVVVDPAVLAQVAAQLQQHAAGLRTAAPALLSAWQRAAGALSAEHTGGVLADTWAGSRASLEEFAVSVESLALALRVGAARYANAEAAAVLGSPARG